MASDLLDTDSGAGGDADSDVASTDAASVVESLPLAERVRDIRGLTKNIMERLNAIAGRVDENESEIDALNERLTSLELRMSEFETDRQYGDLSFEEKVGILRQHVYEKACTVGRPIKIDYDSVRWEVFDGKPSPSHCYDLMKAAAEYDPETRDSAKPGFEWYDKKRGKYHLRVNPSKVRMAPASVSSEKNAAVGEAAD